MNSYQLQARMKNGTFMNLDCLDSLYEGTRLVDIDQFTNAYSFWDFLTLVEPYLKGVRVEEIDSFVIAIRGKKYHYSVCFENPYLSALFKDSAVDTALDTQIAMNAPSFVEMRRYLFQDFDQKNPEFLTQYPYQNQLLNKVHRYAHTTSFSSEDFFEKEMLKGQILKEMKTYKTYRSLCLYRKRLERQKTGEMFDSRVKPETKKREEEKKEPIHMGPGVVIYRDREDGIVTRYGYSPTWENSLGEEREEFLEEEEIKEMVKTYGEN